MISTSKYSEFKTTYFEITLGVFPGYNVKYNNSTSLLKYLKETIVLEIKKNQVTRLLMALNEKFNVIFPARISKATIPYKHGKTPLYEPVIIISGERNPRYFKGTDEEWRALVKKYAEHLGEEFQQKRVYVSFKESTLGILKNQEPH